MMRLAVIMNPTSAKGKGRSYRERIMTIAGQYPVEIEWLSAECALTARQAMSAAVIEGVDGLIVAGGDGTIHQAVNALGDSQIPLGILAVGSGNDIARHFKLPVHKIDHALHQVMSGFLGQRFHRVDVIEISAHRPDGARMNDAAHPPVQRALAIVSVGLDAEVNYLVNRLTWPQGNLRYVRGIIQSLRGYEPYGVKLTLNGKTQSGPITLISAANTRFFGGGFEIAPDALDDDGLFDVVIARGLSLPEFASLLPKLVMGKHLTDPRVHMIRASELLIEPALDRGGELPMIMADGEEIMRAPAKIRLIRGGLRLVV
ncbi:MAG: diacylglycerol kinase family lipid kinase [Actinomycetaceae bacterium]|nr:diacylglycerol kinase family lipid kinase [Actinomycetaceae bacterium]